MPDKLDMAAINGLPHPLTARFVGDEKWPIHDIDVETGLMRIDVCGLLQCMHFTEVTHILDADGGSHDAERFWNWEPKP